MMPIARSASILWQAHPGKADLAELQPFYRALHAAIRARDNETMLMYSGMEVGDRLASPVGFEYG